MPDTVVICNTPPLIYLYSMDLLWILEKLYKKIIVSSEVVGELDAAQMVDKDVPSVYEHNWIEMRSPDFDIYTEFKKVLGPVEASALALASSEQNQPALIVMDDRRGRVVAKEKDIRITGTLGVIMKAKISGHIDSVKDRLEILTDTNYYIDSYYFADILSLAGETEV